jgi:uncharacterized membrane protein YphA (DoxX/SURF4 family)
MKYLTLVGRVALGAWFVVGGLNYWLRFLPQPIGATQVARQFTMALIDSHLFAVVKAIEVLAGACILFDLYAPLMLVSLLPISVVIVFWDVMLDRETVELIFGPLVLVVNALLMLAYYDCYRPMLVFRGHYGARAGPQFQ